ncbi:hypothetical protein HPB49_010146 [Dermacentor silvarum]|uniref:Uncharacterized protein n=1 Tax=Dermacentor silvarum TaxID=543639 RepID=A0ACB8DP54_DERSI|nr:hypothetical protein HPB49_010146 [Dermacentor silvarum]
MPKRQEFAMCPLCWTTLDLAVQRFYSKSRAIKVSGQRVHAVRATRKQAGIHRHTTSSNIRVKECYTGLMPVFLPTGRAWAITQARSVLLRFLLDTGSQRTIVRRDVARALNCPVQGVERFTPFTFGKTHRPVTLTCSRVSVTLRIPHNTNETTIDGLEVPEICGNHSTSGWHDHHQDDKPSSCSR